MAQRYTKFSNLPNKILKSCSQNSQKCLLTYTFFTTDKKINNRRSQQKQNQVYLGYALQKKGCSRIPFSHKNTIFTNQHYETKNQSSIKTVVQDFRTRLPQESAHLSSWCTECCLR